MSYSQARLHKTPAGYNKNKKNIRVPFVFNLKINGWITFLGFFFCVFFCINNLKKVLFPQLQLLELGSFVSTKERGEKRC